MKKLYTQPNIEFINLLLATDVLSTSTPEDNVGDIWGDGDDLFGDDFFDDDFVNSTESPVPSHGNDFVAPTESPDPSYGDGFEDFID